MAIQKYVSWSRRKQLWRMDFMELYEVPQVEIVVLGADEVITQVA